MTFVDTLAFQLFTLAFISVMLFYSGVMGYITLRKYGPRRTLEHLKAQAVPLGGIGLIVTGIGFWGELVWPLPGSYNILFFDPYVLLGIVLLGFAICVGFRWRTQYVGLLAALTGVLSIYYGYTAYTLHLTKEPLTMFFLYVALGGTAVFTFPVTLFIDRLVIAPPMTAVDAPSEPSAGATSSAVEPPALTMQFKALFGLFLLFLLFAAGSAIVALSIGGGALQSHSLKAP